MNTNKPVGKPWDHNLPLSLPDVNLASDPDTAGTQVGSEISSFLQKYFPHTDEQIIGTLPYF